MEIRKGEEVDVPEVVSLLKLSLGESLMPKSDRYWRWKHLANPFGPSPVLLCKEGDQLIGVRAFMRWEWLNQGKIYRAVRAVDTATHPKHQGKGIFKKLTLSLVDSCKRDGDDFVFNTPNKQSRPGYLKMGWEQAGKLPLQLYVHKPIKIILNLFSRPVTADEVFTQDINHYLDHSKLDELIQNCRVMNNRIVTNISVQYLRWRYSQVPVANYIGIGEESGNELTGLIIARVKDTRAGRELRITDSFIKNDTKGTEIGKKIKEIQKKFRIDYTSLSGTMDENLKKIFSGNSFKVKMGPIVTIRSLAMTDLGSLKKFNHWSPSLGDLELF